MVYVYNQQQTIIHSPTTIVAATASTHVSNRK